MNLSQEKALYHLTGQTETSEATLRSIQQLTEAYPYFAPAQCLLAFQFKKEEHPMLVLQANKTALYFTNPFWLQYQLKDDGAQGPKMTMAAHAASADTKPVMIPNEPTPPRPAISNEMAIPTVEAVKEMMRRIDPLPAEENNVPEPEDEIAPTLFDHSGSENKISSLLSDQLADFKKPVEADAQLDIEVKQERLFMVDYFASQGIKIDLAAIPQDKLTTHLRKFTDWLKQVKQGELNPKDLLANIAQEQAVAQTAQTSIIKEDVFTEAMAEVLEKQGQAEKAIEVYEKLSFLNPEKSSYFAAKIEQLKGI